MRMCFTLYHSAPLCLVSFRQPCDNKLRPRHIPEYNATMSRLLLYCVYNILYFYFCTMVAPYLQAMTTLAPFCKSAFVVSMPSPLLAPVTTATFPDMGVVNDGNSGGIAT